MGRSTSIAWTSSTVNFAYGCRRVSDGCKHCYMYRIEENAGRDPEKIRMKELAQAEREIMRAGKYIFVNSMTDTFGEFFSFEQIDKWFDMMGKFPKKIFQVLTKRTNRMIAYIQRRIASGKGIPPNIWLGVSVEDMWHSMRIKTLQRIRKLLPKHILFVSFEPLLGPMPDDLDMEGVSWAIVGGESGYPKKYTPRPMKAEWAEGIRLLCEKFKVAFFFKQNGGIGTDGAGGNLLNGKTYQAMPDAEKNGSIAGPKTTIMDFQ